LADKQTLLEKLQRQAKTSNQMMEKLQEQLDSMESQVSSLMLVFEDQLKVQPIPPAEDYDARPLCLDPLPEIVSL